MSIEMSWMGRFTLCTINSFMYTNSLIRPGFLYGLFNFHMTETKKFELCSHSQPNKVVFIYPETIRVTHLLRALSRHRATAGRKAHSPVGLKLHSTDIQSTFWIVSGGLEQESNHARTIVTSVSLNFRQLS